MNIGHKCVVISNADENKVPAYEENRYAHCHLKHMTWREIPDIPKEALSIVTVLFLIEAELNIREEVFDDI